MFLNQFDLRIFLKQINGSTKFKNLVGHFASDQLTKESILIQTSRILCRSRTNLDIGLPNIEPNVGIPVPGYSFQQTFIHALIIMKCTFKVVSTVGF